MPHRRHLIAGVLAAVIIVWAGAVLAAQTNEALEERVRQLASELRCPVCQNLSVYDSPSGMATEMKDAIRERLQRGESPEQIRAFFVSKYGEWILLKPTSTGFNLVIWLLPFVAAVFGLGGILWVLRRWAHRPKSGEPAEAVDPIYLTRVREEVAIFTGHPRAQTGLSQDLSAKESRLRNLNEEKYSLYEAIQELELDYHSGKLSAADYEDLKQYYEERAARILKEIEKAPEKAAASPSTPRTKLKQAPAPSKRELEALKGAKLRTSYLVLGAAVLLGFGLALGVFLTRSVQPRNEGGSMTGGFLTGTPGGQQGMVEIPGPGTKVNESSSSGPLSPEVVSGMLEAARKSIGDEQYSNAKAAYEAILKRDPQNIEAITYMGYLAALAGHSDVAMTAYDKALKLNPRYAAALYYKGLTLEQGRQDHTGAVKVWEEFLQVIPDGEDAKRVRGWIAEAKQKASSSPRP